MHEYEIEVSDDEILTNTQKYIILGFNVAALLASILVVLILIFYGRKIYKMLSIPWSNVPIDDVENVNVVGNHVVVGTRRFRWKSWISYLFFIKCGDKYHIPTSSLSLMFASALSDSLNTSIRIFFLFRSDVCTEYKVYSYYSLCTVLLWILRATMLISASTRFLSCLHLQLIIVNENLKPYRVIKKCYFVCIIFSIAISSGVFIQRLINTLYIDEAKEYFGSGFLLGGLDFDELKVYNLYLLKVIVIRFCVVELLFYHLWIWIMVGYGLVATMLIQIKLYKQSVKWKNIRKEQTLVLLSAITRPSFWDNFFKLSERALRHSVVILVSHVFELTWFVMVLQRALSAVQSSSPSELAFYHEFSIYPWVYKFLNGTTTNASNSLQILHLCVQLALCIPNFQLLFVLLFEKSSKFGFTTFASRILSSKPQNPTKTVSVLISNSPKYPESAYQTSDQSWTSSSRSRSGGFDPSSIL